MILRHLSATRRWFSSAATAAAAPAQKPFFVTTPIFYVNAAPHIGHLYSAVIADAAVRFERLLGQHAAYMLTTGTDEHGSKIQQAAARHDRTPADYCADISSRYRRLFDRSAIAYTDYIRTTETRHRSAVAAFWRRLQASDSIYTTNYAGWYCVPDETFLTESQLREANGVRVSAESGHPVEWTEEQNYMFRLSRYQDDVVHWLRSGERIRPPKFGKMLLEQLLQEPLPDVSVSRPSARVHWGIEVPGDPTQTVYVWLDALVNYLTCAGYPDAKFAHNWPPSMQVIGKDIMKFHGIYWPAFLIAAGLEPPQQLHVHSHWTVNDEKMSKSKLNVVDPAERAATYTFDGMRYFLLREGTAHSDGNYSDVKLQRILNAELADTLGNLLSRGCARTVNVRQVFPRLDRATFDAELLPLDSCGKLVRLVDELPARCFDHYRAGNFYLAVDAVIEVLHAANGFFEAMRPWELRKAGAERQLQLDAVLGTTLETLRVCGIVLQPIVPELSGQLLDKLVVGRTERQWSDLLRVRWRVADAEQVAEVSLCQRTEAILFRRIRTEEPQAPTTAKAPTKRLRKKDRV